jgi:hypothetical protein
VVEHGIRTEPERFAAALATRPRARIVIEASTDSEWVARCLEALGHAVIVADPNFAPMYVARAKSRPTGAMPGPWPRRVCSAPTAPQCFGQHLSPGRLRIAIAPRSIELVGKKETRAFRPRV